ncbi:hypothetical protein XELAEV_18028795mg [Xenopus laevis]|uniref:Uncharacterized protein n=1 Tax=Xenopus laevis TaxID=8355 RepID=A0A974HHI7_XENLA|nr:hypothetical protein XELAEV_18028795mg [Xenopus laevis]
MRGHTSYGCLSIYLLCLYCSCIFFYSAFSICSTWSPREHSLQDQSDLLFHATITCVTAATNATLQANSQNAMENVCVLTHLSYEYELPYCILGRDCEK